MPPKPEAAVPSWVKKPVDPEVEEAKIKAAAGAAPAGWGGMLAGMGRAQLNVTSRGRDMKNGASMENDA